MQKTTGLVLVALGLLVIGASSSWALYGLCGGYVYNQNGVPQDSAYVQGMGQELFLTDYSNSTGLYGLNYTSPPPTGYYDICARKPGVGHDGTTIYHEYGHSNEWNAYLSGDATPCPDNPNK